jgi:hypothetical protein
MPIPPHQIWGGAAWPACSICLLPNIANPQTVGLYLATLASNAAGKKPNGVHTIERRLPAIGWHCTQHGQPLDRADRHMPR